MRCCGGFREFPLQKKLGIISGSSLLFGIMLGYVLFPVILKFQLKREMSLRNKTDMKEMWEKLPFPLMVKIYLFNVTNPDEANRGEKAILKEVGPYVYEKWIEKVDLQEFKEDDSIEFKMKNTYRFVPELSEGLTGDELIHSPQLLMIGTANYVARYKQSFFKLATKALDIIFLQTKHLWPLHRVGDILFDGVKVNCSTKEFSAKGVCAAYKTVKGMDQYVPNNYQYSLFKGMDGVMPGRYKVSRGIKNITSVGQVMTYNNKTIMDVWPGDHCNIIKGTDTTIFKPFLTTDDVIWTFNPDVCRSLGAVYEKKSSYKGIKALRYSISFGDLPNEPENQCFCPDYGCPPKGMMDIYQCINALMVISLPHFYDSDPKLLENYVGLTPTKELHETILDMEPITGTPLYVKKRIQLNTQILNIPEIEIFSKVKPTYFPILWFEESIALNKTYINMLKYQLFYPKKFVTFLKWFSILGGLIGSVYTFVLYQQNKKLEGARNPTPASSASSRVGVVPSNNGITPLENDNNIPGVTQRY